MSRPEAIISALMPYLYPSSIHEMIEMGLLGIAMSRYSGCWVGMKVITETVETTAEIDLNDEMTPFIIPADFEMPPGGLNIRWPDAPNDQERRLHEHKLPAALAFARANQAKGLTFGGSGIGSTGHLTGELLNLVLGLKLTHVPYRGSAPAIASISAYDAS